MWDTKGFSKGTTKMVSCKSKERQTTFVEAVGKYVYPVFSNNRRQELVGCQLFKWIYVGSIFRIQDWETFPISWWTDGRFLSFLKIVSKWNRCWQPARNSQLPQS